ncbi:hypothetical protein HK100_004856 [Physocladia obscura]|uniref:Uncharacterized protein n=1 Tax=Physocladia obscura TaxID=109957 RepID=A0AAD5SSC4_9FUNG|nr:hypothetical protein HK100_004856 [Physocladia obscura]
MPNSKDASIIRPKLNLRKRRRIRLLIFSSLIVTTCITLIIFEYFGIQLYTSTDEINSIYNAVAAEAEVPATTKSKNLYIGRFAEDTHNNGKIGVEALDGKLREKKAAVAEINIKADIRDMKSYEQNEASAILDEKSEENNSSPATPEDKKKLEEIDGDEEDLDIDDSGITAQDLIKNEAKLRLKGVREEDLVWLQGDDEEFANELRARHEAVMQENQRKKNDLAYMRKKKRNERRRAKSEKERALREKLQAQRQNNNF